MNVNHVLPVILVSLGLITAVNASAQVAGSTTFESATVSVTGIAMGWSAKKKFLGKTVYNEDRKKVGKIEDIIIAPDGTASYLIVSAGGFAGVGKHNVAVPAGSLVEQDKKLVLPGATKAEMKDMPKFEYEKQPSTLIDIGLPGIDGYEVARRVRASAQGREVKLAAFTGYGQEEDMQRAKLAGFDACLVKPIEPAALERVLAGV